MINIKLFFYTLHSGDCLGETISMHIRWIRSSLEQKYRSGIRTNRKDLLLVAGLALKKIKNKIECIKNWSKVFF